MVSQLKMPAPRQEIFEPLADLLARRRIFFGHQSVGNNLIEGLTEGLKDHAVHIREGCCGSAQPGLLHARIGRNKDPLSKIDAFASIVRQGLGAQCEFALFKFCYVDIDSSSDVDALFKRYVRTMDQLRREFPLLSLGHVTVPLRSTSTGPFAQARQLLGQVPERVRANARRNAFNRALFNRYGGFEPVFDLANVESTSPVGKRSGLRYQNEWVPSLAPCYTSDGGHLNALGRATAAAAMADFLLSSAGPHAH